MKKYMEIMNKSFGAAFLISLGDYVLLKIGNPLGPILFAFGLLGVCYMGLNLFTGKCGFLIEDKIKIRDLVIILLGNLLFGYFIGYLYSFVDNEVVTNALTKVCSWDISFSCFMKSLLCGVIMYIAVFMYRKKTPLGIIFGIPLFIFSGFQHSIANAITMGIARDFHFSIFLCILGNFVGSIVMWFLSKDYKNKE